MSEDFSIETLADIIARHIEWTEWKKTPAARCMRAAEAIHKMLEKANDPTRGRKQGD